MQLDDRTAEPGAGPAEPAAPPPLLSTSSMLGSLMAELAARHETRQGGGWTGGIRCGLGMIDAKLRGLRPKSTTGLLAEPNIGKSSLANQILYQAAAFEGQRVVGVYVTLENDPENLLMKHLARISGWTINALESGEIRPDDPHLLRAVDMLAKTPLFYVRGNSAADPSLLIQRVNEARNLCGGKADVLMALDYLQLYSRFFTGRTQMDQIGAVLPELKRIAAETGAALLVVVSQNRETNKSGNSTMFGARGSGEIEYDFDTLLTLTKSDHPAPSGTLPLGLTAQKTRYGGQGATCRLNFNPDLAYFDRALDL